jgi:hypothetical protein
VTLDLGDEAVTNEIRLVEVDTSTFARVGPLDVQQDRDSIGPNNGLSDLSVDAFSEHPVECCDHVSAAPALVRVIIVTPPRVVGEEPTKRVEVFGSESQDCAAPLDWYQHGSARYASCETCVSRGMNLTSPGLHRLGQGCLGRGELFSRADLDELGSCLGLGRVTRRGTVALSRTVPTRDRVAVPFRVQIVRASSVNAIAMRRWARVSTPSS